MTAAEWVAAERITPAVGFPPIAFGQRFVGGESTDVQPSAAVMPIRDVIP
jgi:hypothetical protein